jgi:hypothetical protein
MSKKELHSLGELAQELANIKCEGTNLKEAHNTLEKRIASHLYQDTLCNITFWVTTTVHVSGYQSDPHSISFPFTLQEFLDMVNEAEVEGCERLDALEQEKST